MMEKNAQRKGLRATFALALALALALVPATLAPTQAHAAEAAAFTYGADGNKVEYATINAAVAADTGKTIYLARDVQPSERIVIGEGKTVTIDMMGYVIQGSSTVDSVFYVEEDANLTVKSSSTATLTFEGYGSRGKKENYTVTTGGLVCGGMTYSRGGAFFVNDGGTLTLRNVTVGGNVAYGTNETQHGGAAIGTGANCRIYLEQNTQLCGNYSYSNGGAIELNDANPILTIDNSSVTENYCDGSGAGIHAQGCGAIIHLRNGASVSKNASASSGGGVAFDGDDFDLDGDGTASISENFGANGGGVEVTSRVIYSESGEISGLKITDNEAFYQGGGINLCQNNVTVSDCTVTGNTTSGKNGAGICVAAKNDTVKDCTVTGNTCNLEGGGIYVYYRYDLNVSGTLVVENNKRADGAADDVFLDSTSANDTWAYLKGTLSEGSHVGFRTGVTGDRRLMKELGTYIEGTLFMDMDAYHLSYGSSDHDLWQRKGEYDYQLTLNGEKVRRFNRGDKVSVNGKSDEEGEFFVHWDTDNSTGISGGISDTDKYNQVLSFTMPQNDVHLVGVYASPLTSARVDFVLGVPTAGQELPTIAAFRWYNSTLRGGAMQSRDVSLTWYEVDGNGKMTQASGVAKAGTAYVASFSVPQDTSMARVFSSGFADDGVSVHVGSTEQGSSTATSVDSATGTLSVTTCEFKTDEGTPAENGGTITVNLVDAGLAGSATQQTMLLDADGDNSSDDLIGEVKVSYAEGSSSVTIAAPSETGWNFCNWEKVASGCSYDDENGTVTVNDLSAVSELTATYTPVVTEAKVGLDAPAVGSALPNTASSLEVTCTDGSTIDLAEYLSADGTLPVTWSGMEDGATAEPMTTYTALIELADDDGITDVEKVLSPNAVVTANGTQVSSAGFTVQDDKLYLCVTFPETQAAKLTGVTQPEGIELSFGEAKAYQAQQEAATDDVCWPLPKSCAVTLEGGSTIACDVTWNAPAGFDENATGAQTLTATGTLVLPSYISAGDVSLDVTCTINVAAPEGDDKGDDDDKGKGDEDKKGDDEGEDDKTTPDSGKGAEKDKTLPQTGDTNSSTPVIVLAVAGVALIIVAVVLMRRKK